MSWPYSTIFLDQRSLHRKNVARKKGQPKYKTFTIIDNYWKWLCDLQQNRRACNWLIAIAVGRLGKISSSHFLSFPTWDIGPELTISNCPTAQPDNCSTLSLFNVELHRIIYSHCRAILLAPHKSPRVRPLSRLKIETIPWSSHTGGVAGVIYSKKRSKTS